MNVPVCYAILFEANPRSDLPNERSFACHMVGRNQLVKPQVILLETKIGSRSGEIGVPPLVESALMECIPVRDSIEQ
jgi:hypothetical protein